MVDLNEFGLAQVDTGQIYLHHRPCGMMDETREVRTANDVVVAAYLHVCPPEGEQ